MRRLFVFFLLTSICALPTLAECPGYESISRGCALSGLNDSPWPGSDRSYSCRQQFESLLFLKQLPYFQTQVNLLRLEIEGEIDKTERALATIAVLEEAVSYYGLVTGAVHLQGATLVDTIALFVTESDVMENILIDGFGIDPIWAEGLVSVAVSDAAALTKFMLFGDPIDITTDAAFKMATIWHGIRGTWSLDEHTRNLSALTLGWWYLEDFYKLGGSLNGTGVDAHGFVALAHGLPPNASVHDVIEAIAEEMAYRDSYLLHWFTGQTPYDLDEAVRFAEGVKARVALELNAHQGTWDFEVRLFKGDMHFGIESGRSSAISMQVENADSEVMGFCWTARQGVITGNLDHGFRYHAPDRVFDETDPEDSTDDIRVQINNGLEIIEDTVTVDLKNRQVPLEFEIYDLASGPHPTWQWVFEYRLAGETEWTFYPQTHRSLTPGQYAIEVRPKPGYQTPPIQDFSVPNRGFTEKAFVRLDFHPETVGPQVGDLRIQLSPGEGRWRLLGESAWQGSGAVVSNLPFGAYDVEFANVAGWVKPGRQTVYVDNTGISSASFNYSAIPAAKGSLGISLQGNTDFLSPGLRFWRVGGDETWRGVDHVYQQLPQGSLTVELKTIHGWIQPADQSVSIGSGMNSASIEYTKEPNQTFLVGGAVLDSSRPVPGVTISGLPGGPEITNRFGRFRVRVPDGWQGSLTPSKTGLSFEPASIPIHIRGQRSTTNFFQISDTPPVPDRTRPVVKVLSPSAGVDALWGEELMIRWSAEDDRGQIDDIRIEMRNAMTHFRWIPIIQGLEDRTEYLWTVPDLKTMRTEIQVLAIDQAGNIGKAISEPFNVSGGGSCRAPDRAPRLHPWVYTPHADFVIDWTEVRNTEMYRLQEDTHPSFPNPTEYQLERSFKAFSNRPRDIYYYRVKAVGACGESPWSDLEDYEVLSNEAPAPPFAPNPANSLRDVARSTTQVHWDASDPNGDSLEYDVYFGRQEPLSKICRKTERERCDLEDPLVAGQTYLWRVVAIDRYGERTSGPIWNFTTEAIFPDLQAVDLWVDNPSPEFESEFQTRVTIRNRGDEPSPETELYFALESLGGAFERDFGRISIPQLGVGESSQIEKVYELPSGWIGPYLLTAHVDRYGRIPEAETANNRASLNMTIVDTADPTVEIFRPAVDDGRTYRTGFDLGIRWRARDNEGISEQEVDYSVEGGPWQLLATDDQIPYDGYDWTLPDELEDKSVRFRVRVLDGSGNAGEGISDAVTIYSGVAPEVEILWPVGGEILLSETPYELKWQATSPQGIEHVDLRLYVNGQRDRTIASRIPNTGTHTWSPPNYLVDQDFNFAVEAEGLNNVETLVLAPGTFHVADSFQVPLPWHAPLGVFSLPEPPPIPENAFNYFGLDPEWDQGMLEPRLVVDGQGVVHMIAFFWESIRMQNPGANWIYRIGRHGFVYRTWDEGIWSDQQIDILMEYDESEEIIQRLDRNAVLVMGADQTLHMLYSVKQERVYFNGSSPDLLGSDLYYTHKLSSGWANGINVSQTVDSRSDRADMVVTDDGMVHVAWRDRISGHSQIYMTEGLPGAAWSTPRMQHDHASLPALGVADDDQVILLAYQFTPNPEIFWSRGREGAWSAAATLWDGSSGGHAPETAKAPSGDLYAFVPNGSNNRVSRWDGESWEHWAYEIPGSRQWTELEIFFDSTGSPHLAYEHYESNRSVVAERRLHPDGSVGPMHWVDSTSGSASEIELISTPQGRAYAIWLDSIETGEFEPIRFNYADHSDDFEAPQVTVIAPAGGEVVPGGLDTEIRWVAEDNVGVTTVDLEYSTDGEATFTPLVANLSNTGAWVWSVPAEAHDSVVVAAHVRDANGNVATGLSQAFSTSLAADDVTLLTPNGGETLASGDTLDISWQGGDGATFRLELSLDDGVLWSTLAQDLINATTFSWTAPEANTARARIRVVAEFEDESRFDISDGAFAIQRQSGPFDPHSPQPQDGAGYVQAGSPMTWLGGHSDGAAVTYTVYFGPSIADRQPICTGIATQCPLPDSLQLNTQYYWQVVAAGPETLVGGPIWTFFTGDPSGLQAPSTLVAMPREDGAVQLDWQDDNEPGVEHAIEKQWPGTDIFVEVARQSGGLKSFMDPDVEGSQEYVYRVRAIKEAGAAARAKGLTEEVSASSNEERVEPINRPPAIPHGPSPDPGSVLPTLQPDFAWSSEDPDPGDTVSYRFSLWHDRGEERIDEMLSSPQWNQQSPLLDNTLYRWRVAADDDRGESSLGPVWTLETPAEVPDAPTQLEVHQEGNGAVTLTWSAKLQDGEGLFLERRLTAGAPFLWIQTMNPGTFLGEAPAVAFDAAVSRLVGQQTEHRVAYRVGAFNEEGLYSLSEIVEIDVTPTYPRADLSVTLDNEKDTLAPGEEVTWTALFVNPGPEDASDITASLALPASVGSTSWLCQSAGGAECLGQGAGAGMPSLPLNLPTGSSVSLQVTGVVDGLARGEIEAAASIQLPEGLEDPSLSDNQSLDLDEILPRVDLAVDPSLSANSALPGEGLSLVVTLWNQGDHEARLPALHLDFPEGSSVGSIDAADWSCQLDGLEVDCAASSLGAGTSLEASILFSAPDVAGVFEISASALSDVEDLAPSDNASSVTLEVEALSAPTIDWAATVGDTGDQHLDAGEITDAAITQILLRFDQPMVDAAGDSEPVDITRIDGYRLVFAGSDDVVSPITCMDALGEDDVERAPLSVSYDAFSQVAALSLGDPSLPAGSYRLWACGDGVLQSEEALILDGDGDGAAGGDFSLEFRVHQTQRLVNPNFDAGLDGWELSDAATLQADSTVDATSFSSGSLHALATAGEPTSFAASQCLEAGSERGLLVRARVQVTSAFLPDPEATFMLETFAEPGCQGTELTRRTLLSQRNLDEAWRELVGLGNLPANAQSFRITLGAESGTAETYDLWIDEASVLEALFVDGFESGDLSEWSVSIP